MKSTIFIQELGWTFTTFALCLWSCICHAQVVEIELGTYNNKEGDSIWINETPVLITGNKELSQIIGSDDFHIKTRWRRRSKRHALMPMGLRFSKSCAVKYYSSGMNFSGKSRRKLSYLLISFKNTKDDLPDNFKGRLMINGEEIKYDNSVLNKAFQNGDNGFDGSYYHIRKEDSFLKQYLTCSVDEFMDPGRLKCHSEYSRINFYIYRATGKLSSIVVKLVEDN